MEERENIMKFYDEDGNVVELEIQAEIYLDETKYLILAPLDNDEDEFVFREDVNEEGKTEYNAVESDEEFQKVKKEYSRVLYEDKE